MLSHFANREIGIHNDVVKKHYAKRGKTEDRVQLEANLGIIDTAIQLISDMAEDSDSVDSFIEKLEKWFNQKKNDS